MASTTTQQQRRNNNRRASFQWPKRKNSTDLELSLNSKTKKDESPHPFSTTLDVPEEEDAFNNTTDKASSSRAKNLRRRLRKRLGLKKRVKKGRLHSRNNPARKTTVCGDSDTVSVGSSVGSVSTSSTSSSKTPPQEAAPISGSQQTATTIDTTADTDMSLSAYHRQYHDSNPFDNCQYDRGVRSNSNNPFGGSGGDDDDTFSESGDDSDWDEQSTETTPELLRNSTFSLNLAEALGNKKHERSFFFTSKNKEDMIADMNVDFTEVLVEQMESNHGSSSSAVEAHLQAANHLVHEFFAVDRLIQDTFMPVTIQEIIFGAMEAFLYPRLSILYAETLSSITPREAAKIVRWMDEFTQMVTTRAPDVELLDEWSDDCALLTTHFMETGVRAAMRENLANAVDLRTEEDIREDADLNMVSGLPEQVGFMFAQQITVAQETLPRHLLPRVLAVCNEELARSICDMQLKINTEWKDMPAFYFCAIINDADRLAEQAEERNEEYLVSEENDDDDDDEVLTVLVEKGNRLIKDLAELALNSTTYLCQRILLDLCAPRNNLLTSVGDRVWEADEGAIAMERTIATFKDFFADLQIWLISDYYFLKVLKTCFELTVQIYLESFFGNSLVHGIQSPEAVAEELRRDFLRLVIFFNGSSFERHHGAGGFYSTHCINDELRILQNMAAIIDPTNEPEYVHEDIVAVLKRFSSSEEGSNGIAAVLHLVGLRKLHRGPESLEWVKAIAVARKEWAGSNRSNGEGDDNMPCGASAIVGESSPASALPQVNTTMPVHVPDLRNSKFIHNIRPTFRQPIDRYLSESTRGHAESTLRLLETHMSFLEKAKKFTLMSMGRSTTNMSSARSVASSTLSSD